MSKVKFGWSASASSCKRQKLGVIHIQNELQESLEADEERERNAYDEWMRRQNKTVLCLEDAVSLSVRRQEEGCVLAEAEKYREAITRWQEAIELTPTRAVLYELQAQCYMELGEPFDAVRCAEQATIHEPQWAVGYLTLGRAQLNFGELEFGVKNLKKAVELDPTLDASEDLQWAAELMDKKQKLIQEEICNGTISCNSAPTAKPLLRMIVGNKVCLSVPLPEPSAMTLAPGNLDLLERISLPTVSRRT